MRPRRLLVPFLFILAMLVFPLTGSGCPECPQNTGPDNDSDNINRSCTSHEDCDPPNTYCFGGECSAG